MAVPKPLTEIYHDLISISIDEKGIEIPHGVLLSPAGEITMVALAVGPTEAYAYMLGLMVRDRPSEMIFALDRFTKPGQGTDLGDVMAGHHFVGRLSRPFIIEYRHAPRIVKPIDWRNSFWNAALTGELAQYQLGSRA